jgi:hypothetical protein
MATARMDVSSFVGKLLEETTSTCSVRASGCSPILLQVDQQLPEGPRLRVPPERADRVGAVEVRGAGDVQQFGTCCRRHHLEPSPEPRLNLVQRHGRTLAR